MLEIGETTEYVSIPRDTYEDLMDIYAKYNCLYSKMDLLVDLVAGNEQLTTGAFLKAVNSCKADKIYKKLYENEGVDEVEQD